MTCETEFQEFSSALNALSTEVGWMAVPKRYAYV